MTLTPGQLQEEQRPWVEWNFGPGQPHQPLLGMIEELGELGRAIDREDTEDIRDSLADFVVFCADYCTKRGWDYESIFPKVAAVPADKPIDWLGDIFIAMGAVAHHQLKTEQGIRGSAEQHAEKAQQDLLCVLTDLESIAKHFGWTLMEITEPVWAKVKLRDFKKNSVTGGEVQP
jgi:NTP pyrophosphatase (non-canonical NTP hydrolase)